MKTCWEVDVSLQTFINSALDRVKQSAARTEVLISGEIVSENLWVGDWMSIRADLRRTCRDLNLDSSVAHHVALSLYNIICEG